MAQLTQPFFRKILAMEGGFQCFPNDNGNYNACGELVGTNMGVSAVAYSQWVGRCPSEAEMCGITKAVAFDFYSWYFDRYQLFGIESQDLFELVANNTMGNPQQSAKAAQRALVALGYPTDVDGSFGPQTIGNLNKAARERGVPTVFNAIRQNWVGWVQNVPTWGAALVARMEKYFPEMNLSTAMGGGLLFATLLFATLLFTTKN